MIWRTLALAALTTAAATRTSAAERLSAEQREQAIVHISKLLVEYYVFEDVANECADYLYEQLDQGAYDGHAAVSSFADLVTKHLQEISHDKHLRLTPGGLPPDTADQEHDPEEEHVLSPERLARMAKGNFGFRRAEIFDGNIGYLDLRGFQPASVARETACAALQFLGNAEVVILDLRRNGGGEPSMVELISSYFLPEKIQLNTLYDRVTDEYAESWTLPEVPGQRMLETPVIILTSSFTFSAAEAFTYNFKVRQRATIIGENTGGGAHAGDVKGVGEHLSIFLPRYRAINPITESNWEGSGIAPDLEVASEHALERAMETARDMIAAKQE